MEINAKSAIVKRIASVAEWSIATGCKPVGHSPTKVRILPGAPKEIASLRQPNEAR